MSKTSLAPAIRRNLDDRYKNIPSLRPFTRPTRGWIAAIRHALGMSYRQMATRMSVDTSSIGHLERSEQSGKIQLSTLRRAAEALNCTLVYAIVPNEPLEQVVKNRAREVARRQMRAVDHTMRLEKQSVSSEDIEKQLDLFAAQIPPRTLWDD